MKHPIIILASIAAIITLLRADCVYTQREGGGLPYPYNGPAFKVNYTNSVCKEYVGDVCCNEANALLTADNLKQLDGVFATKSGGCDVCAINLKRFWCQYACSPRQADFLKVSDKYYVYPDPQRPGKTIVAQQANLTVEANTACALFSSCKRIPFVNSVSAMGSPAGFLNFQGHNAINNALQYISVEFTYDPSKGLYFNNATQQNKTAEPTSCDFKGSELHGFPIEQECDCSTCEQACDVSKGYHYAEPEILEDFNYGLVLGVWGGVIAIAGGITYYRYKRDKLKLL